MKRLFDQRFTYGAVVMFLVAVTWSFVSLRSSAQNLAQVPCTPNPSGAVSWWPGNGNANDIVGPNNGTLQGATASATGKVGQAFGFNGVGDFVDIPDSPSLDSTSSVISVEGWVNPEAPNTDRGYIFARRDPYVTESFSIHIDPQARIGVILRTTSSPDEHGSFFVSAPGVVQFGQWQHIAVTLNTTTGLLKAYVNAQLTPLAVLQGPSGFSGPTVNADHTFIGQRQSQTDPGGNEGATGAAYFKGLIDELALYSVELTQSEIANIYFADTSGKCLPQPTPTPTPTPTPISGPVLAFSAVAPPALTVTNGQYSPNPFNVVTTVRNNGNVRANNVVLTITLPVGLTLTTATPFISVGNLAAGQQSQVTWQVRAVPQGDARTLTYSLRATASNAVAKTIDKQITLPTLRVAVVRNAPYDFFNGCNATEEIEGNGLSQASAIALSQPLQGKVSLNVGAAGVVARAFGRAGVGVNYTPGFTGTVKIGALVRLGPGVDVAGASAIILPPRIIVKAGVAGIVSDVFITAAPPVDAVSTFRFRSVLVTPLSGTPILNQLFVTEQHVYNPPEEFYVEHLASVTAGSPLRICAGVQSRATSTAFPGVFAFGRVLYSADVLEIRITPQ
jgi:hypothetical protein